ncbi:hypothetical protein A2U01_0104116, partial [Trifolium medium]|nr:hypothetical protein [Trifolium medium]
KFLASATESDQEPESSWLQRQKASTLAGRVAGQPCSVLESKVAV